MYLRSCKCAKNPCFSGFKLIWDVLLFSLGLEGLGWGGFFLLVCVFSFGRFRIKWGGLKGPSFSLVLFFVFPNFPFFLVVIFCFVLSCFCWRFFLLFVFLLCDYMFALCLLFWCQLVRTNTVFLAVLVFWCNVGSNPRLDCLPVWIMLSHSFLFVRVVFELL